METLPLFIFCFQKKLPRLFGQILWQYYMPILRKVGVYQIQLLQWTALKLGQFGTMFPVSFDVLCVIA